MRVFCYACRSGILSFFSMPGNPEHMFVILEPRGGNVSKSRTLKRFLLVALFINTRDKMVFVSASWEEASVIPGLQSSGVSEGLRADQDPRGDTEMTLEEHLRSCFPAYAISLAQINNK